MKRNVMTLGLTAAVLFTAATAQAGGLVISAEALSPEVRTQLSEEIAAAKKRDPASFDRVARVMAQANRLDAQKRGRLAPMSPLFKALGPGALWPMIEAIAFDAARVTESESARLALDVGLIEAAGMLRDERASAVWVAVLDSAEQRPEVVRAAAGALARLDTDAAAQKLVALAKGEGLRRDAALAMMGNCRRLATARALADALEARPDDAQAKQLARSLGDVGNAWAWKTPAVKARSEEGAIRALAAEALLRAYLAYDGDTRQTIGSALLVVNAPTTSTLIAAAKKSATEAQREALAALEQRLQRSPVK